MIIAVNGTSLFSLSLSPFGTSTRSKSLWTDCSTLHTFSTVSELLGRRSSHSLFPTIVHKNPQIRTRSCSPMRTSCATAPTATASVRSTVFLAGLYLVSAPMVMARMRRSSHPLAVVLDRRPLLVLVLVKPLPPSVRLSAIT